MKIRLAAAAAAALAAPILLPATHALASTTNVASPSISSHVSGGCGDGCGGGGIGLGGLGGGCGHGCGGFNGFSGFKHEHIDIDVFFKPCATLFW